MTFLNRMKKIFLSKVAFVIYAIVIGVVAWLLVMDATNPVVEMSLNVDVTFENFNAPAQQELSLVSDLGVVSAEVKVSGRQSLIKKLLPSDLSLKVDFSKIEGTGSTFLPVAAPECSKMGIKIEDYYPKEIAVNYDKRIEMYLPVTVNFTEALLKSGYEIIDYYAEPASVPISGFASAIEFLEYISVDLTEYVDEGSVASDKTLTIIGRYITNGGNDVTANFDPEKVTVKIDVAKRVPITYGISGDPAEDYFYISDKISNESVLLDGNASELASIKAVDLGAVNISGVTGSFSQDFAISDYISNRLYVVETKEMSTSTVKVDVEIGHLETRTITVSKASITRAGYSDIYTYDIVYAPEIDDGKGNILVTIKGKSEDLDKVKASTLKPSIDLQSEGIYKNQNIEFDEIEGVQILGEYLVDITVKLKPTPSPTPSPTPTAEPTPTPTPEPNSTPVPDDDPD